MFAVAAAVLSGLPTLAAAPDWAYIENTHLKLGVRKDAGACIGFLAGPDGRNVLNSFDHGRFVQQSYYGSPDGSLWGKIPWRYNPVQGGDYKGKPATLLEFRADGAKLYSKTQPRQWASGADVPEMVMEQWAELQGSTLHLRIKMTYSGKQEHIVHDQEIPAVFVNPEFTQLVVPNGKETRRWSPGWPNESLKLPERWAAWLDEKGWGLGVFVPVAEIATCYRYGDGKTKDSCSYIAPLTRFALTPGKVFEYDAYFTLGAEAEIRERFAAIKAKPQR